MSDTKPDAESFNDAVNELAKLKRLYPKHSERMILNAIDWALRTASNKDRRTIEGHIGLYLNANPPD